MQIKVTENEGVITLSAEDGCEAYYWIMNNVEYSEDKVISLENFIPGKYFFVLQARKNGNYYMAEMMVTVR